MRGAVLEHLENLYKTTYGIGAKEVQQMTLLAIGPRL